jgi:hypothetical protein
MTPELLAAFLIGGASSSVAALVVRVFERFLKRHVVHRVASRENLLVEARGALRIGANDAAVILASAALEAELLKRTERTRGVTSIHEIVDSLLRNGELTDSTREAILGVWSERNQAAHRNQKSAASPEKARAVLQQAEAVLSSLHSAAA